jgi:prepilin-type N-terminal cleavage/methylation domain-containing protein
VNAHRRDERGFTLIELIIAITLMGLAVGAVFGGLGLFFKIQDTQQSNARIDAEIRNYAERILAQSV